MHSKHLGFLANALVASAFKFTGPPDTERLNLSAPVVTISYSVEPFDTSYVAFDLGFRGKFSDVGTFMQVIGVNIPLIAGNGTYAWEPADVYQALELSNASLSDGKDFSFQAAFKANLTDNSVLMPSGPVYSDNPKYFVTGFPMIGDARSVFGRPGLSFVVAVTSLVGATMVLL